MLCVLIRIHIEAILMSTHNIPLLEKNNPELSPFASWPGAVINPQWLELPMSRTNFHGPKDVRAIEVRLYNASCLIKDNNNICSVLFKTSVLFCSVTTVYISPAFTSKIWRNISHMESQAEINFRWTHMTKATFPHHENTHKILTSLNPTFI